MSTVAIGAGVVASDQEEVIRSALIDNIRSFDDHLTVGATGAKWLLRTLSAGNTSNHDTALQVVWYS